MLDTPNPEPVPTETLEEKNNKKRNALFWVGVAIALCVGVYAYFLDQKYWPYTDDAYVNAHYVDEAAQVSGPISALFAHNNEFVHKNQLLFVIDPRPFQAVVDQQTANLKLAVQQMEADVAAVDVAVANVSAAKAQLIVNQKNYDRTIVLVQKGQASIASGDDALGQLQTSQAQLIASQNQLIQAQKVLGDVGERNAQIQLAQAQLESAKLNLSFTRIYAPADGYMTNLQVRVGTMVTAQQTLFELVESHKWWIDANYKETQMARIKPNQPVSISIDMYPGIRFKGYVDSISRGSGTVFSLLPPENATGNWVKVTQRFAVKIIITDSDPKHPLRVGSSSEVSISTLKTVAPV
ncbi:MAG: HlyD family secretion protein [Legionellales bacterium]|nr:HlyD family secretion protein [Legionellales bacterium]